MFNCCGVKKKAGNKIQKITRDQIEKKACIKFRFNDQQLYEFTNRFESIAYNGDMTHKQYRESLGLLGVDSLSFMADRIFRVMDKNGSNTIDLIEYLKYIDIMMYGDDEERMSQSFQLMDTEG